MFAMPHRALLLPQVPEGVLAVSPGVVPPQRLRGRGRAHAAQVREVPAETREAGRAERRCVRAAPRRTTRATSEPSISTSHVASVRPAFSRFARSARHALPKPFSSTPTADAKTANVLARSSPRRATDEVDRLERKVVSMPSMYGRANPKPEPPSYDAEDMRKMRDAEEKDLLRVRAAEASARRGLGRVCVVARRRLGGVGGDRRPLRAGRRRERHRKVAPEPDLRGGLRGVARPRARGG